MSDESECTMYASVVVYLCCAYTIQSAICGANGVLCAYYAYGICMLNALMCDIYTSDMHYMELCS